MKKYKVDPIGNRFGRLVCISKGNKSSYGSYSFNCICDCGKSVSVLGSNLVAGRTKSCGCFQQEVRCRKLQDGRKWHRVTPRKNWKERVNKSSPRRRVMYRVWRNMVNRCNNPKFKSYEYYGGRGIKVCDRWLVFDNFLEDVGFKPVWFDGKTVFDRINNDGNYEPGNVRWTDYRTSNYNRRKKNLHLNFNKNKEKINEGV